MKWIKKTLIKIKELFTVADAKAQKLTKFAIKVTNIAKSVIDSPVDDIVAEIVKKSISGNADDVIIDEAMLTIKEKLPSIVIKLNLIDAALSVDDPYEKANAILAQVKFASDDQKNLFYHSLATTLIGQLSDGKFTFGECCVIAEMVYQEMKKNNEL